MIKIKINEPLVGKNKQSFIGFMMLQEYLKDYSIQIVPESENSYDYLFVGAYNILNKGMSLEKSIKKGLEYLDKITGDYFLFDGSDSTSLMGAYEVFEKSKAIYLFKNQLLAKRGYYNYPTAFNKWFFGIESDFNLKYDIPEDKWDRIKLSGWNLGYLTANHQFRPGISLYQNHAMKFKDICAVFQAEHPYSEDHGHRNDLLYTKHRTDAWKELYKLTGYDITTAKLSPKQYQDVMRVSKLLVSPFGMGELCYRDFESLDYGNGLVKPDMTIVNTYPNIYIQNETYISVNHTWDNLNEQLQILLGNPNKISYITERFKEEYQKQYTIESFCMHWYNIFSNLNTITKE